MTVMTQWTPYYQPQATTTNRRPKPRPRMATTTAPSTPRTPPTATMPAFPRQASPVEFAFTLLLAKHKRQQAVVREHRPSRRRLRIVRFAGFPIPALITRCQCCGAIWPCRELFAVVRERLGYTKKLDRVITFLRKHTDLNAFNNLNTEDPT